MKESRQEHQRNTEAKGNPLVCKGSQENAINGRRKECAQGQTLVVSFTMRINVGKWCDRPLLFQNRRRTAMGKFFERKSSQWQDSVWEEISKTVQRPHQWRVHETCDFWRRPECQHHKTQSGCKCGEKCVFRDKGLTVSQTTKRKRMVVKALLPCGRIPSNSVAYSRMWSRRNPKFTEGTKSLAPKRSVQVPKGTLRHVKLGKKESFARCDSEHWCS